ncbi:MAG: hypothetical protein LBF02_02080 [Mycoplasmataceae bacterium]|nr:hypothetical protein [Mycoplasmataceae bacterium]
MTLEEKKELFLKKDILDKVAQLIDFNDYLDFCRNIKYNGLISTIYGKKYMFKITKEIEHKIYGIVPFFNITIPKKYMEKVSEKSILAWCFCNKILKIKPIEFIQAVELIVNKLNGFDEILYKQPIVEEKEKMMIEDREDLIFKKYKQERKKLFLLIRELAKHKQKLEIEIKEKEEQRKKVSEKNYELVKIINDLEKKNFNLNIELEKNKNLSRTKKQLKINDNIKNNAKNIKLKKNSKVK